MTVAELREHLEYFPDDYEVEFTPYESPSYGDVISAVYADEIDPIVYLS